MPLGSSSCHRDQPTLDIWTLLQGLRSERHSPTVVIRLDPNLIQPKPEEGNSRMARLVMRKEIKLARSFFGHAATLGPPQCHQGTNDDPVVTPYGNGGSSETLASAILRGHCGFTWEAGGRSLVPQRGVIPLLVGSDPCPISPGPLSRPSRPGGQWHDHSARSDPSSPESRSGASSLPSYPIRA